MQNLLDEAFIYSPSADYRDRSTSKSGLIQVSSALHSVHFHPRSISNMLKVINSPSQVHFKQISLLINVNNYLPTQTN